MYLITIDPQFATRLAQHHVDQLVQDAAARRAVREVRRAAASPVERPVRRGWRFAFPRRAFA